MSVRTEPLGEWLRGMSVTTPRRFWSKVRVGGPDECWTWIPPLDPKGYARIRLSIPDGKAVGMAHRVAYELLVGPIPTGMALDHLCRTRSCVNPRHLEPVTAAENSLRGFAPTIAAHRRGECLRGHRLADDGAVLIGGRWTCRTCCDARNAARRSTRPRKTHCPQGHPYDETNTKVIPSRPNARYCRACHRDRDRASRGRAA